MGAKLRRFVLSNWIMNRGVGLVYFATGWPKDRISLKVSRRDLIVSTMRDAFMCFFFSSYVCTSTIFSALLHGSSSRRDQDRRVPVA